MFKLFIHLISYKTNTNICFNPFFCKMKYRSSFQITLCYTKSSFYNPKSVILFCNLCRFKSCIGNISS